MDPATDDPPIIVDQSVETKFTKSRTNRAAENQALAVLATDSRFQSLDSDTKRALLRALDLPTNEGYGTRSFDVVMTPGRADPISADNVATYLPGLRLVEMKATRKAIADERLNGFFFGATDNEYRMAKALGDRYLFAFVVLNDANRFGRPFAVLLSLNQVEARTRVKRLQYQVNFRSDMISGEAQQEVLVLGRD